MNHDILKDAVLCSYNWQLKEIQRHDPYSVIKVIHDIGVYKLIENEDFSIKVEKRFLDNSSQLLQYYKKKKDDLDERKGENAENNKINDKNHIEVKSQNSYDKDVVNTSNFILKPSKKISKKKTQFGKPIAFRGLRFAPINEQGVVYLFGMVSRELGFLIESIRTEFPDCEGKRCVDLKKNLWEHVLIEFEYSSKNFKSHGHNPDDCDLIVCWKHNWNECPIEVLELKSIIKNLRNSI